jgi:nicotinamidase-related amidase
MGGVTSSPPLPWRPPGALLLVDLQHDFLDPSGAFPRRHVAPAALLERVLARLDESRSRGDLIVWVTSVYGELPGDRAALRGQTHVGAPCCVRGSAGAALVPAAAAAVRAGDERVEKAWYSAFRGTGLHERLRARGVRSVRLAGVATSVCVLATARDARALGHEVTALADATAAGSLARHRQALGEIASLGGQVIGDHTEIPYNREAP